MNIRKALIDVFSANVLQLISSLIVGFVVPSILSIDGYASLKTYTLYGVIYWIVPFWIYRWIIYKIWWKKV